MKTFNQFIQEKLSLNKNLRAKTTISIDDPLKYLQKYGISIMSEDDIHEFNHVHTIKYNINETHLSKLRKWHGSINDKANEQKFHDAINYLQTIDNNISTITLSNSIFISMGWVAVINIKFDTSKFIQIKLPSPISKIFWIELYDKNKIEEHKNIALYTIKYILENP